MQSNKNGFILGISLLKALIAKSKKGALELEAWLLAANNHLNRANAIIAILNANPQEKINLISETRSLKEKYIHFFADHLQPIKLKATTDRLFDPLIYALKNS